MGGEAVIVLEGIDNVLDFNYIYLGEDAQYYSKRTEPCSYLLKQAAVKNKRKEPLVGNDPVIKLVQRINLSKKDDLNSKKESYAIALRQSGGFDLYIDMTLTDSVEGCKMLLL